MNQNETYKDRYIRKSDRIGKSRYKNISSRGGVFIEYKDHHKSHHVGHPNSDSFLKIYNKSLEMQEKDQSKCNHYKQYITKLHQHVFGNQNSVFRVEVVAKTAFFKNKPEIDLYDLIDTTKYFQLFKRVLRNKMKYYDYQSIIGMTTGIKNLKLLTCYHFQMN